MLLCYDRCVLITAVVAHAFVSFAAPTDIAARLLPKLGEAVGLRLEAGRLARDQVLLIQVRDMDRTRLLRLVADTTGGAWESIEGGYRLVLGEAQAAALWKRETAAREAWITQAADDPTHGWSSEGPPAHRAALAAVAKLIGASTLAALRPGTRQVWSLSPAAGERLLPPAAREIVGRLVAERRKALDTMERKGYDVPVPAVDPLMKAPVTIVFAARQGRDSRDVGLALGAYDAKGGEIVRVKERIVAPLPIDRSGVADHMPIEPKPFSKDTQGWAAVLAHDATPGPAGYARYAHPETSEPLGFAVGPAIEETATFLGVGVVACLPDAPYALEFGRVAEKGLSKAWPKALAEGEMDVRMEGGTLVVRPSNPGTSATLRADRALLRRRITDVERDGQLNFRYSEPFGLEYTHLNSLPANLYEDLYPWEWPWGPPLAWNSLTPAQQSRALGDGLPLREVPGFGTTLYKGWGPQNVRGADESLGDPITDRWLRSMLSQGVVRARIEATPMAVVKPVGRLLPEALDYGAVTASLAQPRTGAALRAPGSAFYPAVGQKVSLQIVMPSAPSSRFEASFNLAFRTSDVPTRYPTLFPALREALNRSGG